MTQGNAATAAVTSIEAVARPKRLTQPRHAPEVLEMVAQARRLLSAELGQDLTDGDVFELLVKAKLQGWVDEQMAALRASRDETGGAE